MTKIEILDRIDLLKTVQSWSKINNTLTAGQRICLSQERAALMRCVDYLNENPDEKTAPWYRIPHHLEEKVQHLYRVMQQQWRKDPKSMLSHL